MRVPPYLFVIIPVAVLIIIAAGFSFLGDFFWFEATGYKEVFLTIVISSALLGVAAAALFFGFSYLNAMIAAKNGSVTGRSSHGTKQLLSLFCLIFALLSGISMAASWEIVLRFINQAPFGIADPIFGLDAGFYIFSLPFYSLVVNYFIGLIVFAIIASVAGFLMESGIFRFEMDTFTIAAHREDIHIQGYIPQLSVLLFLLFTALAARIWLARYDLLFTSGGTVYGVGYTDANVTLPVLMILSALAVIIGIGFLINEKLRRTEVIKYGVGAFVVIAIIGMLAGGIVQALVVEPNEFNLERPYLENNIGNTLIAYGLDDVDEEPFTVTYNLTAQDIIANSATIKNIRLWDWRPLKLTYEQLQLFRTYYNFNDIDVDRYTIDGMYKEVLVSAREMDIRDLPSQAQTWVNTHLVYTHGYGAVMNPVDVVSTEGLPAFYLKDIPPTSDYINLEEPRIYYGEETGNYVVTKTETEEFDYPFGDDNIYTDYMGKGGVALSDGLRKLIYAIKFGSVELLVSGSIEPESKLLMHRSIGDRVQTIAPFLSYDPDPYVVVADGKLYWIMDAYTTADKFPYSQHIWASYLRDSNLNYIRNSVKVVIDAYNGDVSYYVIDRDDPLIQTYREIFPDLFRDFKEMPDGLKSHIRYPQGLFEIQSELYSIYHMKDPMVFYNREDAWSVPDELYRGSRQQMEPYYVIMKLPGEHSEEFILMLPFTPRNKENMIAWMAARSDPDNYGSLVLYQFSKQELTYGPMQIEARVDQDTEISQDITLWSQSGSSVVRGNTLIIPIENSILYVEPLYLEATERGTLPQLKRVIVAYNDRLTMQDTLAEAIDVIFGDVAIEEEVAPGGEEVEIISSDTAAKLSSIAEFYDLAQDALLKGELGEYQRYFDEIGKLL